jgi:hypothetical protein
MGADNQAQRVLDGKLTRALRAVLNEHSQEQYSNTPDWILANYLLGCLDAFAVAVRCRDEASGAREGLPRRLTSGGDLAAESMP